MPPTAASLIALPDDALLRQCDAETFRASGPGGQHRNKTDSAVRLRHRDTGIVAQAYESRSQHENRARALARLRTELALQLRAAIATEGYKPPPELLALLPGAASRLRSKNPAFWLGAAHLLDLLAAEGWALAPAAARLGVSTGQLSRLLLSDPALTRTVNEQRTKAGLHPLR